MSGNSTYQPQSKALQWFEKRLPIGGLMTDSDPAVVTEALHKLKALATVIGCLLEEPFLQLSFLALPVIPPLKITDKGLVAVHLFRLLPVVLSLCFIRKY